MAWARRSGATLGANVGNPGSSWNAGNLGATPSANDRIIAVVDVSWSAAHSQPSVTGITDSAGNSWTRDSVLQPTGWGYFEESSVWSCVSNGSAVNSITVAIDNNLSANAGAGISVGAYSGISTTTGAAGAVDISKVSQGFTTTVDSGTTAATTTAANELKIGAMCDGGGSTTLTAGTLDTTYSIFIKNDANGNGQTSLEDADSGASGSTARSTTNSSVGTNGTQHVLVYKLAAGGGSTPAKSTGLITLTGVQ